MISSDAGYADAVEEVYAAVDSGNQSTIRAAIDALEFRFPEAPESIASRLDRTSKRAGAEAALAEATQLPKNLFEEPVVQAEIAAIKYRGGDVQAALSAIEAALLQAPDHRGLLRSAAAIFRRANKTDRQAEILKHYIDIRPYDPWGHDEWAKHLLKKRAWGELRGFLRTVPFAYERSYRYKLLLAQMAMSEEDVEGCETHARAAYQLAPGSPKAASTLAFALFYLGRYDEAEILANEAVVIEPTNRSSRETLAKIARLRGDASDIKENPMPYTVDTAANFADINRFGEALDLMSKDDPSEYTAAMLALEATTSQTLLRLGTMRTRLAHLIHRKDLVELRRIRAVFLSEDPEGMYTYLVCWAVEHLEGNFRVALKIVQDGAVAYPNSIRLRAKLMESHFSCGEYLNFYRLAAAFLESPPKTSASCAQVYTCLIFSRRPDLAARFLSKVEQKFPNEKWPRKSREGLDEHYKKYWSSQRLSKARLAIRRWFAEECLKRHLTGL